VQPAGTAIALNYTGSRLMAYMGVGKGLSVDHDAELAVAAAFSGGLGIYDISNPAAPVEWSTVPGYFTLAAVKSPFVWAAKAGSNDTLRTFDITNPSRPLELDHNFWNPSHPWNSHSPDCEWPNGSAFSPDATALYMARHAVVHMVGFDQCPPPAAIFSDGFESGGTGAWN
jgi:hypothetical protein